MNQQENIYELPLFKSHVLLLVDTVADFSGRVELIDTDKLREIFLEKVKSAPAPSSEELKKAAEVTTDEILERAMERKERQEFEVQLTPEGKVDLLEAEHPNLRPTRKAFSRREMLRSLVNGDIHPSDLKSDEEFEEELPENYFEAVLDATLSGDLGIRKVVAYDGKEYLYFRPLISNSYARLLSAKDNPEALICDQIRENSRIYPRPVPLTMFKGEPFKFSNEELELFLEGHRQKEENRVTIHARPPAGIIFLYSDRFLEDDFAEFLAEEQERRPFNP